MTPVPVFRQPNQDLDVYKPTNWLAIVCGVSTENYQANFSSCVASIRKHSEEVSALVWNLFCALSIVRGVPLSSAATSIAAPTSVCL